ncbi:MAG TPA: PilX N-terminal domain-containing pilus assembly protein [Candidatus Krumholzibacteria bacterium]|nr:PilX N-terminal domain-containing pilus assembly protein [Candidatus Krumholzibacteria bacterium]
MKSHPVLDTVHNERGNILVIALLLVFASFIIGGAVAMMSSTDLKISGNQEMGTEAQFNAEAGIAEAVHRVNMVYPTNVMVGGQQVNASIQDMPPIDPNYKAYIMLTPVTPNPTIVGSTITAGTLQDLSGDYLDYSKDSGTNEVVTVEHKWQDLNGNGTRDAGEIVLYDPLQVPPENFKKGNPVEVITVTGHSGTGKREVQTEVTRLRLSFKSMGAMYSDKALTVSGSSVFCGYNHDLNTPVGTVLNACYAYHLADDHLAGVATTGDVVSQKGANKTDGQPPTNTDASNLWYSLAEALGVTQSQVEDLLANPDNTSITPVIDGITYINGNATINAGVVGHGLLYVTGDVTINGGFHYWGMIYVEGDCKITGTPWILGAVMVKGSADFQFSAGNCGILYSEDAVQQYVGGLFPMVTLAWREM